MFTDEQKLSVRQFLVQMSQELGSQSHLETQTAHYLTKLNTALVAIVKQEWNTSWKSFINDICGYGQQGEP